VPGIYTKLIDVDKVNLVVSGYATNMVAPAMPVVMQKNKVFPSLFALDANHEFKYPKYFSVLADWPEHQDVLHRGLLSNGDGAESEAQHDRARCRGCGIFQQRV
jgi:branched-chain amino acid transport system substrate-binding protein